MREPAFWNRPSSLPSRLLTPFGALYGAIVARRMVQPKGIACRGARALRRKLSCRRCRQDADRSGIGRNFFARPVKRRSCSAAAMAAVDGPVRVDPAGTRPLMSATSP